MLQMSDLSNDDASSNQEKEAKYDQVKKYGEKYDDNDDEVIDNPVINRNYWYRGELMKLVPDCMKEIINNQEVVIEQKIELLEILSGCETANRYNVYLLDKKKTKKFLFKCKEESSWFCRNCVPSDSRSFDLKMIHIMNSNKETDYKKTIVDFERPFKWTCFCCFRPELKAYSHVNEKGQKAKSLGKIMDAFSCGPILLVYGEKGEVRWKIYGEYCQCGFCCREISIGKCYEVDFWIYDANADVKVNRPVGNIHKVFKGLSELITDADAFILTFPKKATGIERLMLIGAVIMIDYRFYESNAMFDCGSII